MSIKFHALLVVIFCISSVYSLKCWYCNSYVDPLCSDPFDNRTAIKRDCDSAEHEKPHLRGIPASMCRKIRMKINGEWRIHRDCARLGEVGIGGDSRYCIYRTGTYNIHMEYCTCNDKDQCNSASTFESFWNIMSIGLGTIALLFYRNKYAG